MWLSCVRTTYVVRVLALMARVFYIRQIIIRRIITATGQWLRCKMSICLFGQFDHCALRRPSAFCGWLAGWWYLSSQHTVHSHAHTACIDDIANVSAKGKKRQTRNDRIGKSKRMYSRSARTHHTASTHSHHTHRPSSKRTSNTYEM